MTASIHRLSDVQSPHIGPSTRIWQFTVMLPNAQIGSDCNICSHCFIENDVIVGDRVTVKCGVHLWDGTRIEDDVFIGPNVTFTNDPFSRSKHYQEIFPLTIVKPGAFIGGGGNAASQDNNWAVRHGGRVRGGDSIGARWCGGGGQPGADRALCGHRQ
jgi:NDP-sugar pyrophosphorylase family protein